MIEKRYNSYTPAMMAYTKLEAECLMEKDPVFKKKIEDMIEEVK